jgi:hypothetical protein
MLNDPLSLIRPRNRESSYFSFRSKPRKMVGVERVYFIKDLVTGNIKIGKAINPAKRLKSLQTGNANKLVIVTTQVGGEELENELHRRFATSHISGEWFYPTKELEDYISALKQSYIDALKKT